VAALVRLTTLNNTTKPTVKNNIDLSIESTFLRFSTLSTKGETSYFFLLLLTDTKKCFLTA
jgi:hypothetical protein